MSQIWKRYVWRLGFSLILLVFSLSLAVPVRAGGVVGNGTPGSCTETALNSALSGGGTITFNCGVTTIALSSTKTIAANTTIDGGGNITLSGNFAVRLFSVNGGKLLTLKNIVLEKGYGGSSDGGAIFNDGQLILDNTTIQSSVTPFHGGAIFTNGHLDITNSTLAHNIATSGGAIYADGLNAQIIITGTTFDDNDAATTDRGGAIYTAVPLTIANSEFSNNTAGSGGAVYASRIVAATTTRITDSTFHDNQTTGSFPNANGAALLVDDVPAIVENSTLHHNVGQSGGAIYVLPGGKLTVRDSTLSNNLSTNGGGLYNKGTAGLTNVTLSRNDGSHGGGIDNFSSLVLTNVTLSGNTATYGGGLKNEGGTATLTNVTLSNNSAAPNEGGGIFNIGMNTHLQLKNVLIANSPAGGNCKFAKAPDSSEFNLSSDNTCNFGTGRDGVNVLLGVLADNGGFTKTHLPQANSPAIDNGTFVISILTDQRAVTRPQGAAFDVGAVERQLADSHFVYLPVIFK